MYKNWDIIKSINGNENKVKYRIETDIRNSILKSNLGEKIRFIEGSFKVFHVTIKYN